MAEPRQSDDDSGNDGAGAAPQATGDASTERVDLTGRVLGDFCLLRKLGKGGMADVYLAEQSSLRRQVAIKIMRPDFVADPVYVKRFRREASAAGGLNHPNIVQVYMVGEVDGIHFISQEYVQGRNLKEFITRKGPLEVPIALHILKQVAAALQVAAEKGIVHRDIKPENILLTKKGEAKVADFGLAQLSQGGDRVALTQVGVTMGTPLYMSPEQVHGKQLDGRSDIYSLGVMAWHMLVGRPPFTGETALAVAVKHLNEQPPSLADARPDIPVGVRNLVERMMSKNKEDRPADAQALLAEIKQLIRQVTNKEAPAEAEFRPSRELSTVKAVPFLDRALKKQAGWMALSAALVAGGMAGVGWAMRISDPLKTPVLTPSTVKQFDNADGQFYFAQGNPTDEAAWYAAKAKLNETSDPAKKDLHDRMRDRCDIHLAMIYLNDGRREQALRTFNDFATSPEPWRRAHGLAGMAIFEDLKGEKANRAELMKNADEATRLIRQVAVGERHFEPVVDAAIQDVIRRRQ